MNIGKSVRILLVKRSMKQSELAKELGISRPLMSYVCSRESCSHEMLGKLCKAFDLKSSELIAIGE